MDVYSTMKIVYKSIFWETSATLIGADKNMCYNQNIYQVLPMLNFNVTQPPVIDL